MPDPGANRHKPIPVYAARLPSADAVLPYLARIDASGVYSNRGPLVIELESRVHDALRLTDCRVVTTASGTAAIQAAILAAAGRASAARPLAVVPAYTFAATAHAAEACGYQPLLADIEPGDWCLSASRLRHHPALPRVGLVLPVACYGRPHSQTEWASFRAETGIPVVIDGASSFEAIRLDPGALTGSIPVAISFHATKTFSTGEGGAVLWSDLEKLCDVVRLCNFGLTAQREVGLPGFNGKMSEYHAAIGLASLDAIAEIEAERQERADRLLLAAARSGLSDAIVTWPAIASNQALWLAPTRAAARRGCAGLTAAGIGWRRWYGLGLHLEPYLSRPGNPPCPVTEELAARLIGIPFFPHIAQDAIEATLDILRCATGKARGADACFH